MNRRGNLGTLLLVFGALILIVYALYVMITFNSNVENKQSELRGLSSAHDAIIENIREIVLKSIQNSTNAADFENDFNESLMNLASIRRDSELNTNAYAKLALGDYSILDNGNTYELNVKYIFESYSSGNNELRYNYSIRVLFDKQKIISFFTNPL